MRAGYSNTFSSGNPTLYPGWQIRDITTPAAIASGATLTSRNSTTATVANTVVVGGGILASDTLEFAIPGFAMGSYGDTTEGWSAENTHPWYPAQVQLMNSQVVPGTTPGLTFIKQLLGLQ